MADAMAKSNTILFLLLFLFSSSLLFLVLKPQPHFRPLHLRRHPSAPLPTAARHLAFGIAASAKSFSSRLNYLRLWWRPDLIGFVFLDSFPPDSTAGNLTGLPRLRLSSDSSSLPYNFTGRAGLRSAVRVARVVKDLVSALDSEALGEEVRWVVLGDDDTVFFPANLAAVLGKYDWKKWYYVGTSSEMVEQNEEHSFDMAFGGGGFVLSLPLARLLATVIDSCIMRYSHLYGSDIRVSSCLAELGVGLTREQGFHQVDVRGNIFGLLSTHPLTPLVSLHHLDVVDPIFPDLDRLEAVRHLFRAVEVDQKRILQQTVCYDNQDLRTISVSWGYVVQVFEGNQLLPDLLSSPRTFMPWRRSRKFPLSKYTFTTRDFPKDPCKQPSIFYLDTVSSDINGIWSTYSRNASGTCLATKSSTHNLKWIKVLSEKFDLDSAQLLAPRRQCCDVLPSGQTATMIIKTRKCKDRELISMHA